MIGLHPRPGRQQREASKGPGGGNEPPGRRHDAGEFRHGGTRPQPAAPQISDRPNGGDAYLDYRILAHYRVQPTAVARRPRERSHLVPPLGSHLPAPRHLPRAPAAGGFASRPAPRAGTTFYPCRSSPRSSTTYYVRLPTTRSQDREGET